MPKITSTITRAQTESTNVPRLPKPLNDMSDDEAHAFFSTIRADRITKSEKIKATRAASKANKKLAAGSAASVSVKDLTMEELLKLSMQSSVDSDGGGED